MGLGGLAVVHQFKDAETVYVLLSGERSHPEDLISLPSNDEDVEFEAAFVGPLAEAWWLCQTFVSTGSVAGAGEWLQL